MNKSIFITGASSGLGSATAKLFAEKGWTVFATMRNPEANSELSGLKNIHLFQLDITDTHQINEIFKKAEAISPIDVLFNNAGFALAGPLEGMDDLQLEEQVNTNFLGVLRVTRACLPYFRNRSKGIILTTTSLGAYIPNPLLAVYGATKAALESWSEGMYFELNKLGITSKTIIPGLMNTNFGANSKVATHDAYQGQIDKVLAVFSNEETFKSADSPDDIAETVYLAATDNSTQMHYFAGHDASTKSAWLENEGKDAVISATEQFFS